MRTHVRSGLAISFAANIAYIAHEVELDTFEWAFAAVQAWVRLRSYSKYTEVLELIIPE